MKEKPSAVTTTCRHYWVIEAADGPTSRGVCKICGEARVFNNSWTNSGYGGKDARVFDLPNLLDIEEEEE